MSINTQLHRYVGGKEGWEKVYLRTTIDNLLDSDATGDAFLYNKKIRNKYFDFATTSGYSDTGEKNKIVNGEVLTSAVAGLRAAIAGKKNTYVSTGLDGWVMSDGTEATEGNLSGEEVIVKSIGLTVDGRTAPYTIEYFNIGDVILRTNLNVPDWWVAIKNEEDETMTLYPLETRKIDLDSYAKKDGEKFTNVQSINGYTIGNVISKGFETTMTNTNDNVPTSQAVQTYIIDKQYITKDVESLTNFYTSKAMDTKLNTINERITTINNLVGNINDNYVSSTEVGAIQSKDGYHFPYWNKDGVIDGYSKVYEKKLVVGDDERSVKVITTNDTGLVIPLAGSQFDGVMSKNMYRTFSNFFRDTITSDFPTENVNVGDLCITLVSSN